jgi:hypothetical protein
MEYHDTDDWAVGCQPWVWLTRFASFDSYSSDSWAYYDLFRRY